jgi:VWFA-related protein
MTCIRACALALALGVVASAQNRPEPPRFRVSVDAVSIDAVVTDRDGHVVRDLAAEDFDVFQDGKKQKVTFAQFVPVATAATARAEASARPSSLLVPRVTPAPVTRESVQRTIAIVIDDLGLSVEGLTFARSALHDFIDTALLPSDLVAILRTGRSAGALQAFTTDHRVLHAAVDRIQWTVLSRNGVEPFVPINEWVTNDEHATLNPLDFSDLESFRSAVSAVGSLGALNLAIQGARELPGRKAIVFVTEGFRLFDIEDQRVRIAVDKVLDQAARAGVVIYSLDARGLQSAGLLASDNLKTAVLNGDRDPFSEAVRQRAADRLAFNRDTQEGMAYLAEQTGGFAVLNTNDLGAGLGRIAEDVRDYYVIGYAPDASTFKSKTGKPRLHKISVNVRRPGLRVRTRKEFFGVSDPAQPQGAASAAQQLVRAAISPFSAGEIMLNATALPGFSPTQGMFVRTLLHVDARALTFNDDESGKKTASADVVGLVFDADGAEVAHLSTGFAVALTREAAEDALRDGLVYSLRVPIRRPGGYQLRFALRDRASGALGSAGEFVEMPDISGGRFALSGLVLRRQAQPSAPAAIGSDQFVVGPEDALRVYPPGARLSYAYEVYNAGSEVKVTASVWRESQRVMAAPAGSLKRPADGERRFVAAGGLKLGDGLPDGTYVFELSAVSPDERHPGKSRIAAQRIDFEVR